MKNSSVTSEQLTALKKKLDASIKARAALEEDFKTQSALLIKFISRLSQVSKGLDLQLDNKLANFRSLVTKSAPLADIEQEITGISVLLQKFAGQNEQNIREVKAQILDAGKSLQKTTGLSNQLRRDLRAVLQQADDGKDTLIQYMPLLRELVLLFNQALTAKNNEIPTGGLLNAIQNSNNSQHQAQVDDEIIEQFVSILNRLMLPEQLSKKIAKIKNRLNHELTCDKLIDCFLETFNLLSENLQQERDTAESFLSSLNNTLSVVHKAVNHTLTQSQANQQESTALNQQLQQHMGAMSDKVQQASSLTAVKDEINHKIQLIADIISKKNAIEQINQQQLTVQLHAMQTEIKALELQSKQFESRLHEQHLKSMQDALTKLGNRGAFDEHFAKEIARYQQQAFDLSIVVLDLDNFKTINDTYGHAAGDKTLQVIARTMQKHLPKDVFVGRYGGEEFVLVFSALKKDKLLAQLELLRQKIEKLPFKFKNNNVTITVSMGATFVNQDDNIHIAFERADTGLYQAKEQGKNQVVYL